MRQRKTKDGCKRVRGEEKLKKEVRKIKRRKKEEDMIRGERRAETLLLAILMRKKRRCLDDVIAFSSSPLYSYCM